MKTIGIDQILTVLLLKKYQVMIMICFLGVLGKRKLWRLFGIVGAQKVSIPMVIILNSKRSFGP